MWLRAWMASGGNIVLPREMGLWRVRWATAADAPAIAKLWHRVWHWTYARHKQADQLKLCGPHTFTRRISACIFERDTTVVRPTALIAEDYNGVALGFAVLRGGAEIEHLYVAPEHHGTGLGAALLGSAESILMDERQCEMAFLTVAVRNLQASRFYEKHGWVGTARLKSMSTAPWEPYQPPELAVADAPTGETHSQWGLTEDELDATRMRGMMLKKFLGYDQIEVPKTRSYSL